MLSSMTKARRSGKVFFDWSQNTGAKTTISPYSLRGRDAPTVAAPRTWDEVEAGADDPLELEQLRYQEVLERVQEHGDLFRADAV
jgi:bifunctional non-homologous end joining protein LigD